MGKRRRLIKPNEPDRRIDNRVKEFVDAGKIREFKLFEGEWWDEFVDLLSDEDIKYILSFEQCRNWNSTLYHYCRINQGLFYIAGN